MGNRTSRNTSQKQQRCASNKNFDPEHSDKIHMDSHCTAMNTVLYHHLIHVPPNTDTQQLALNIHKDALNIAMEHHINAAYSNSPNCQRGRQMIYNF